VFIPNIVPTQIPLDKRTKMKNTWENMVMGLSYGLAVVMVAVVLVWSASVAMLPVPSDIHAEHELTGYRILWEQWLGE
jgi:hypothetical protein